MDLPKNLPPAPSTAPQALPELAESQFSNFDQVKQNYINMLQNNETEQVVESAAPALGAFKESDLQNIIEYLIQTSPSMATPNTPGLSTSPAFTDADEFPNDTPLIAEDDFLTGFGESDPLFPPMPDYEPTSPSVDYNLAHFSMPSEKVAPSLASTLSPLEHGLYAFTPESPMLHDFSINPASLVRSPAMPLGPSSFPSPAMPMSPVMAPPMNRRKSSATGTRKGLKPEALVPIDAPTQPRKYVTPSATSRKDLPATFARKRARSTAFGDEEEELEPLGPNATELEQIEYKRRQNTIAARRSRARKLQHQQELEDKIELLTQERDAWKERASMCSQMLLAHGIPAPTFED
jgi:hypothetical protein